MTIIIVYAEVENKKVQFSDKTCPYGTIVHLPVSHELIIQIHIVFIKTKKQNKKKHITYLQEAYYSCRNENYKLVLILHYGNTAENDKHPHT